MRSDKPMLWHENEIYAVDSLSSYTLITRWVNIIINQGSKWRMELFDVEQKCILFIMKIS